MLTSCMTDDVDGRGADTGDAAVAAKFVNSSADAAAGRLLLYVDDATAEAWHSASGKTLHWVSCDHSIPIFPPRQRDCTCLLIPLFI